jgi:hypothetical protein
VSFMGATTDRKCKVYREELRCAGTASEVHFRRAPRHEERPVAFSFFQ